MPDKEAHKPIGARWLRKTSREGECRECQTTVPVGTRALWLMNRGILCVPCGEAYQAAGNPVRTLS